jgi:Meiotically up-regulated gene 113
MSTTKEAVIAAIQRTASDNGGVPLGQRTFERETGISTGSWRGKYWRAWSDALVEAGFAANPAKKAYPESFLVLNLACLTRKNGRFPTYADLRLEREADKSFPAHQTFTKLGSKSELVEFVRRYAKEHKEYDDILALLPQEQNDTGDELTPTDTGTTTHDGFVYMALMKTGRVKHYKIGKAILVGRRTDQISIQLPMDLEEVHKIATDDAYGIEDYWQRRFRSKNTKGEWFSLSLEDVRAFRRRKFL